MGATHWRFTISSKKNRGPEEQARLAKKIRELLQASSIGSMAGIQALFKEHIEKKILSVLQRFLTF